MAREALSARIDGEREPVPSMRVDEHVAGCAGCRAWLERAAAHSQRMRDLAAGSAVGLAPLRPWSRAALRRRTAHWPRWALAAIGVVQVALAAAQALGVDVGARSARHAMMGGHLLNESTAWSVALGVVMIVVAVRPAVAPGLAAVLATFTVVLAVYVIADATAGAVTTLRVLSHLPVLLGTVLTLLVWWAQRSPGQPATQKPLSTGIVLPDNASRGRRRGHLWPTDGSAA